MNVKTTTKPAPTAVQAVTADRAREALTRTCGSGTYELASRIGVLEHHLAELLALVDRLTEDAR